MMIKNPLVMKALDQLEEAVKCESIAQVLIYALVVLDKELTVRTKGSVPDDEKFKYKGFEDFCKNTSSAAMDRKLTLTRMLSHLLVHAYADAHIGKCEIKDKIKEKFKFDQKGSDSLN